MSDDLFREAHDAAESALEQLIENELDGDECACHTCIVREILTVAWPFLKRAALEGYE